MYPPKSSLQVISCKNLLNYEIQICYIFELFDNDKNIWLSELIPGISWDKTTDDI